MMKTAESAGLKILSDETCCKVLAAVYLFNVEEAVLSGRFSVDIKYAQKRAGFLGGHVPDKEIVSRVNELVREAVNGEAEWVGEIEERYNVRFSEESMIHAMKEQKESDREEYMKRRMGK